MDLSNTTANTAGYSGGSGVFVRGNTVPNVAATIYTPSSSVYPSAVATPDADASTQVYRGAVMYVPTGSVIQDITCDYILAITGEGGATLSNVSVFVSNGITAAGGTPTYATFALGTTTVGTAGRQSITLSATNLTNMLATSTDILVGSGQPNLSQLVFTISVTGTSVAAPTGGKFNFRVNYTQLDKNIGTSTTYPYGNLD
jgi:hypothetical protein